MVGPEDSMWQRFIDGIAAHKVETAIIVAVLFVLGLIAYAAMCANDTMARAVEDDENDRMR